MGYLDRMSDETSGSAAGAPRPPELPAMLLDPRPVIVVIALGCLTYIRHSTAMLRRAAEGFNECRSSVQRSHGD